MQEEFLVFHASPVLCGIKAANLFQIRSTDLSYVRSVIKSWEEAIKTCKSCDLKFKLIAKKEKGFLVLAYRNMKLETILEDEETEVFIRNFGYDTENLAKCLNRLAIRLKVDDFPHEIGLFLGYPLDDVKAFIKNKGKNFVLNGTWKVYYDDESKRQIFKSYKESKERCSMIIKNGGNIHELVG
ncbi:DUF3793 family protein [Anaerococcus marasmi]|uniref:DUF3793 family protein n=1 Tax=Anaerococcus marasmi TaxID=2057797 RepID=UPI000CF927C7|nr:DUF3793 family protein [Anaerococcus marasmi]